MTETKTPLKPYFQKAKMKLKIMVFYICYLKEKLLFSGLQASSIANAQVEEQVEVEVSEGYTVTQICDKIIDVFLNEKPRVKEWKRYLILREEWNKYRETFYNQCRTRADKEIDPTMKQKFISLESKVKKV